VAGRLPHEGSFCVQPPRRPLALLLGRAAAGPPSAGSRPAIWVAGCARPPLERPARGPAPGPSWRRPSQPPAFRRAGHGGARSGAQACARPGRPARQGQFRPAFRGGAGRTGRTLTKNRRGGARLPPPKERDKLGTGPRPDPGQLGTGAGRGVYPHPGGIWHMTSRHRSWLPPNPQLNLSSAKCSGHCTDVLNGVLEQNEQLTTLRSIQRCITSSPS
jgi:hypothetical protein